MKYLSILFVAVIVCLAMVSCSKEQRAGNFKEELFYFKDHQTGVCFAAVSFGYRAALATVPCEKVEKYLK